jgi:hypothetical protein
MRILAPAREQVPSLRARIADGEEQERVHGLAVQARDANLGKVEEPDMRMRILLSEGSGLTSRQVAGRLGELGRHVEVLSATTLCLTRFTRCVRAVHRVPPFGADPLGWLKEALRIAKRRDIDLLFPTQEQVSVLSAQQSRLSVPTIVPSFASLRRVQDKISAWRTLSALDVPQPEAAVVTGADDVARFAHYPAFVKRPIGTASAGVRRVATPDELAAAVRDLGPGPVLVQAEAGGPLAMVQAVADRGRLVAHHANLRVREGVGGGAALKESVILPGIEGILARLMSGLAWHGALSTDAIVTEGGPLVIDVNPRLVEPGNALRAGVDLVGAMLELAEGPQARTQPQSQPRVRTRQTLIAILGAAERDRTRGAVLGEAFDAMFARGPYAASTEELTPVARDPLAVVPAAAALAATLVRPSLCRMFREDAVGAYALTPEAWRRIEETAEA